MEKYKILLIFKIIVLLFGTLLIGCKKDIASTSPFSQEEMGFVRGVVYAENGNRHLPSVKVFVDVRGEIFYTQSKSDGSFELSVPAGNHLLMMHSGNGKLFFSTIDITVESNKTTEISPQHTILKQNAQLAYITGSFDQIETIIMDTLGYAADELSVNDLENLNTMSNYSAIFLNCGLTAALNQQMYDNLKLFVEQGGSLYASDFAVEYLTGDGNVKSGEFVARTHDHLDMDHQKTCTPRIGGFVPDASLCTQKQGAQGMINGASVVHPDIQNVLGGNSMDIHYNLGSWEVINLLGVEFEVLIADVNYGPLAVRLNGNVSWLNNTGTGSSGVNNDNFITICHYPPGNTNNPQTITISVNALQAHLDHGCSVGPCTGSHGNILYTTFHNYPQGNVSQDTYDILQYFILNL